MIFCRLPELLTALCFVEALQYNETVLIQGIRILERLGDSTLVIFYYRIFIPDNIASLDHLTSPINNIIQSMDRGMAWGGVLKTPLIKIKN